jgi:hypothetical protein
MSSPRRVTRPLVALARVDRTRIRAPAIRLYPQQRCAYGRKDFPRNGGTEDLAIRQLAGRGAPPKAKPLPKGESPDPVFAVAKLGWEMYCFSLCYIVLRVISRQIKSRRYGN